MKARSREMVEKAVAAMVSAIEIYNKPDFKYREETFSILAINAWELLLKARWIQVNGNKIRSLYVKEPGIKKDGKRSKQQRIKLTASGNPFTHGLDYLATKLGGLGDLDGAVCRNLDALKEIRDSSVHFYNNDQLFALQLQEVGSAAVKNFVSASRAWFDVDLSQFNFYLMPLAFLHEPKTVASVSMSKEEQNVVSFIQGLDAANDPNGDYSITVSMDVKFERSKAADALSVRMSKGEDALKVELTEKQFKDRYPFDYRELTNQCRRRYQDFKENQEYHDIRKPLQNDPVYCMQRHLDPDNPNSTSKTWYSQSVLSILDRYYTRKIRKSK